MTSPARSRRCDRVTRRTHYGRHRPRIHPTFCFSSRLHLPSSQWTAKVPSPWPVPLICIPRCVSPMANQPSPIQSSNPMQPLGHTSSFLEHFLSHFKLGSPVYFISECLGSFPPLNASQSLHSFPTHPCLTITGGGDGPPVAATLLLRKLHWVLWSRASVVNEDRRAKQRFVTCRGAEDRTPKSAEDEPKGQGPGREHEPPARAGCGST